MAPPPRPGFIIPADLLDDIISRFLLDAPDSELDDPVCLCFLVELAYWFYLDEYVEEDEALNNIKFDPFAVQLLNRAGIKPKNGNVEEMLESFREFKRRVPTYGGLLLNENLSSVLLVQGFWHRASWGFPKGKINVDEEGHACAIREVLEETGFDISQLIDLSQYLETLIGEQYVRLYIIPGVPTNTEFCPKTKGEIKQLKWFPIHQLPQHKNDRNFNSHYGSTNMYYMVMPFIKPLREWLANATRTNNGNGKVEGRRRHRSSNTAYPTNAQPADHQYFQQQHSHSPAAAAARNTGVGRPLSQNESQRRQHTASESSRRQHNYSQMIHEEIPGLDNIRLGSEQSPRQKENTPKSKIKKNLFTDVQEDHQKFTFKSRGKNKIGIGAGGGKQGQGQQQLQHPQQQQQQQHQQHQPQQPGTVKAPFKSYSWNVFQLNKKAVNEALDKVWNGVTLTVQV